MGRAASGAEVTPAFGLECPKERREAVRDRDRPTQVFLLTGLQSLVMERFQFHQWPPQILEMTSTVIHGKKDGGQKENQTPQ